MKLLILLLAAVLCLPLVAICGNMIINTAKADWLHPDYIEPDVPSTTSSEEISTGSGAEAQSNVIAANGFNPEIDGFSSKIMVHMYIMIIRP